MPIAEKIMSYSVFIDQNDFSDNKRLIHLRLEFGGEAQIWFPPQRPQDWLQVSGPFTSLYMTANDFADVYHLIQSESPVFFTAVNIAEAGLMVGAVHTELDLSAGETPGEGDEDPNSLAALIRRAKRHQAGAEGGV